jgi:hypothetical protein
MTYFCEKDEPNIALECDNALRCGSTQRWPYMSGEIADEL